MANPADWERADRYISEAVLGHDAVLEEVSHRCVREGLPPIQVSQAYGRMLELFVRMCGARRVLEIGTLGGYSAICMARALPDGGKLVSLELSDKHAQVARSNVAFAGLADRVEIRVGPAMDSLAAMRTEAPFDLVFIDADKASNAEYFGWAVRLGRVGTAIIVDNIAKRGEIADPGATDEHAVGSRKVLEAMGREPRVRATAIQTVGSKGHDGFALAVVVA